MCNKFPSSLSKEIFPLFLPNFFTKGPHFCVKSYIVSGKPSFCLFCLTKWKSVPYTCTYFMRKCSPGIEKIWGEMYTTKIYPAHLKLWTQQLWQEETLKLKTNMEIILTYFWQQVQVEGVHTWPREYEKEKRNNQWIRIIQMNEHGW